MRRLSADELEPGMIAGEAVYSINGKQILVPAGGTFSDKTIRLIINWDIPFVLVAEEDEPEFQPPPPAEEPEAVAAAVAALPEVMAKKTIHFVSVFESAITRVEAMLEDARSNKTVDLNQFREVAAQVTQHLIQPSEAINRMLFRMPARTAHNYLAYHSVAVAALSGMMVSWMELPGKVVAEVVLAGLLHDIGKTQLPRSIVADTHPSEERQEMLKQHVVHSIKLLNGLPYLSKEVLMAVAQHHECIDGSGYPAAQAGDNIHFNARVIAVAERLSAIVINASRLNPFSLAETLKGDMFTRLDPTICDTFGRRFTDYLMNNPIRLSDGRKAKVVFLPSVNPTSPVLKTDDDEFVDLTIDKEIKIEGLIF